MLKPLSVLLFAGLLLACASSPAPAPVALDPVSAAPDPAPIEEPQPAPPVAQAPAPTPEAPAPAPVASPSPAAKSTPAAAGKPAPVPGSGAAYTGPNPCTHALGAKGIIDQACGRGGIKEAKLVMKDMVKKAKKQGMKVDCDTCHADETVWDKFTPEAKDRFKELLALSQK